jgi:hypothetical protein
MNFNSQGLLARKRNAIVVSDPHWLPFGGSGLNLAGESPWCGSHAFYIWELARFHCTDCLVVGHEIGDFLGGMLLIPCGYVPEQEKKAG